MSLFDNQGWHRFLYTKDNDLDLGYLWVAPYILTGIGGFWLAAFEIIKVNTAMWTFLGSALMTMLIATTTKDRAQILAEAKSPGEIAQGIATAVSSQPNNRTDDERGDHVEREDVG